MSAINGSNYKPTVSLCTLGCKVNQYESQSIAEDFERLGYSLHGFDEKCDIYVINTCTVTAESDRKSRQMIRRAVKSGDGDSIVIVAGCFSQAQKGKILNINGVSCAFGNSEKNKIAQTADMLYRAKQTDAALNRIISIEEYSKYDDMNITHSERTRAFVKIVDGCENKCSYCIIPSVRGKIRSKHPDKIIPELEALAKNGYKEIVLTGIETAAYGKDLDGITLSHLLELAEDVPGIERIRLGSLEPTVIKEDFVSVADASKRIVPHYHLSLQSGSDSILRAMRRKYNTKIFSDKIDILRRRIKDVTFTTDIIVGFPGETDEMFNETCEYVKKCRFLYVHIFPYSARSGTDAADYKNKVPEQIKKERAAHLKEVMLETRAEVLKSFDGAVSSVLFEEKLNDGSYIGHTPNYIEAKLVGNCNETLENEIRNVRLKFCDNTDYMLCELI